MSCVSRACSASKRPRSLTERHVKPGKGEGHPTTTSCFRLVIGDSLRGNRSAVQTHLDKVDLALGFPGPPAYTFPTHPAAIVHQSLKRRAIERSVCLCAFIPAESGPLVSSAGQRQKDYANFQREDKPPPPSRSMATSYYSRLA